MALSKSSKKEISPCDGLPTPLPAKVRSILMHLGHDWGLDSPLGGGKTLADGVNLSPRMGGAVASRLPRRAFMKHSSGTPHGMVFFDGSLVFAKGTEIYSTADGVNVTTLAKVSDTHKSFVIFGDCLYVYPDKLFMKRGKTLRSLELDSGMVPNVEFSENTIRMPLGYFWTSMGFEVGDCVQVVGENGSTPPEGYYHIKKIEGGTITVSQSMSFPYVGAARFKRVIPSMTACCVCGDRLYGIAGRNIHVSAVGSATDFYSGSTGDGTHAVTLSSDAEPTALYSTAKTTMRFAPIVLRMFTSRMITL